MDCVKSKVNEYVLAVFTVLTDADHYICTKVLVICGEFHQNI